MSRFRIVSTDRNLREQEHGAYPLAEAIERSHGIPWAIELREVKRGDRCPGCGVICASLDAEHLLDCPYQGRRALRLVSGESDRPNFVPENSREGRRS